ncbi:MAG TPA: glycosyltransferase [Chloroflexota bacterium]|nr:glycosyltransferase [Chloroflexota bacterium]
MTRVSVIATVRNEAGTVGALLESLERQSVRDFETVVVDGGSTDGTLELLREHARRCPSLRVVEAPGANIASGRNRAIEAARGDVILATDAGVELPPDWVARLSRPLLESSELDVVGGFFASAPQSTFEFALGSTTLPLVDEVRPAAFNPSSRSVAFRRSAWEAAGRYPEWLDYCEDLWFDFELRRRGQRIGFEPAACVAFRPRGSLGAFFRQYFRYARGDGKARILLRRHAIRYAAYAFLAAALLTRRRPLLAPAALGGLAYCWRPWRRVVRTRRRFAWLGGPELAQAIAWVPALRVVGDVAKMSGFPLGLLWSLRRPRANAASRQAGAAGPSINHQPSTINPRTE